MSVLSFWIDWARTAVDTLVWLTLASTLVFIVVAAINRVLPRRAAGLRHALLALVVLRLLLPPTVTSPLSVLHLDEVAPQVAMPTMATAEPLSINVTRTAAPESTPGVTWELIVIIAWFAGVITIGWWLARRRLGVHRMLATCEGVDDRHARQHLAHWRTRFGIRRTVQLVTGPAPLVPFTCGTLRPVIFVPRSVLANRDGTMVESAIAHELAHVRRLDDIWLVLGQVASTLFFFHPIAWLTVRTMGTERELATDRLVLASGDLSPQSYGRSLLRMLGLSLETTTATATVLPKRRIAMRIDAIAHDTRTHRPLRWATFAIAASLGLVLLPPTLGAAPEQGGTSSVSTVPATVSTSGVLASLVPTTTTATESRVETLMPGARLTSGFGMRRHPISGEMLHHDGIDLSTGEESVVYAPQGGKVELATTNYGESGKMGTVVILDHGSGVKTFYAHLASLSVQTGDGVSPGDPIGFAGNTGVSSGPHLHFEIWKDGEKLDPVDFQTILDDC